MVSLFLQRIACSQESIKYSDKVKVVVVVVVIIIIIIISCHRFSFFPGTSPFEPVVNPTTQASSLSL
jgi:hypothetical protein